MPLPIPSTYDAASGTTATLNAAGITGSTVVIDGTTGSITTTRRDLRPHHPHAQCGNRPEPRRRHYLDLAESRQRDVGQHLTERGILTVGTLSGSSSGSAALAGNNLIVTLGDFTTTTGFNLTDSEGLTVTGPISSGTGSVTLTTTTGVLNIQGTLTGAGATLTGAAGITLGADANVTTTGTQAYVNAVTLNADQTLTGSTVTFDSTVDGDHTLTITGNANFDGAVGGTTQLASLYVSGATALASGVATTGTQEYQGAVTLGGAATLTGSTVTFDSTVGGAQGLSIMGNAVIKGAVNIASLYVSGATTLDSSVTTTGTQEYHGAVTLGANDMLTGSTIHFDSTIDGAQALDIAGNAVFSQNVGVGTALTSLFVSGTSSLSASMVTTGTQEYQGAVTLGGAATLQGSTVTFDSTVGGAQALTITGDAVIKGGREHRQPERQRGHRPSTPA